MLEVTQQAKWDWWELQVVTDEMVTDEMVTDEMVMDEMVMDVNLQPTVY